MNVKARRLALGLTQQQLADRAALNLTQYQKIEAGTTRPERMTLKNAAALARALEIPIEKLLED